MLKIVRLTIISIYQLGSAGLNNRLYKLQPYLLSFFSISSRGGEEVCALCVIANILTISI